MENSFSGILQNRKKGRGEEESEVRLEKDEEMLLHDNRQHNPASEQASERAGWLTGISFFFFFSYKMPLLTLTL